MSAHRDLAITPGPKFSSSPVQLLSGYIFTMQFPILQESMCVNNEVGYSKLLQKGFCAFHYPLETFFVKMSPTDSASQSDRNLLEQQNLKLYITFAPSDSALQCHLYKRSQNIIKVWETLRQATLFILQCDITELFTLHYVAIVPYNESQVNKFFNFSSWFPQIL